MTRDERRAGDGPGERKLFKDWFDRQAARRLGAQIAAVWPAFDEARFVRHATRGLDRLELLARVQVLADALAAGLPDHVPDALDILTRSLPPVAPDDGLQTDGWLQWPIGQYIADHGVPHLDASLLAMTELTMRFTSEFAVRPFLARQPAETRARLLELTRHPNPHVRRWCSEGTRPRLPWGKRLTALIADPSPNWPILEALKDDPELYVRRSVANHLNDIAKDHPDLVLARCRAWRQQATPERLWIIGRALRTLVKAGHPDALALLGFSPAADVAARLAVSPRRLAIGDALQLDAVLRNDGTQPVRLVVDFVLHFARPAGKSSAKVFKWTKLELAPGQQTAIGRRFPLRQTSTRTLHPGRHRVELQVNGGRVAASAFTLAVP